MKGVGEREKILRIFEKVRNTEVRGAVMTDKVKLSLDKVHRGD